MPRKDPYELLGVPRNASAEDVKKAYRRLARKLHPDVNPGDTQAEDRFKEVSAAFEVLSDPRKRALYDELGEDAVRIGFDPKKAAEVRAYRSAGPGGRRAGGFGFGDGSFEVGGFQDAGFDVSDLFSELFGRGARTARRGQEPGSDVGATVEISLAEAVKGTQRELSVQRPGTCSTCGGSGRSGARPCPRCGGAGVVSATTRITVKIPAGIADGGKVRLAGQGAAGAGGPPGDLYLEVHVRPHPLVRREGDDLHLSLPVTVHEAIAGATIDLPTFEGTVSLKIPPGSQSGRKLRLRGKGVPHLRGGGRGDLLAELRVVVPTDAAAREAARRLDEHYGGDVRADLSL